MIINSTARRLMTGRVPGMPRQIGQTWLFGAAPAYSAEQPQNILLAVKSWEWTSSPMTASYPDVGGALTETIILAHDQEWQVQEEVYQRPGPRPCIVQCLPASRDCLLFVPTSLQVGFYDL